MQKSYVMVLFKKCWYLLTFFYLFPMDSFLISKYLTNYLTKYLTGHLCWGYVFIVHLPMSPQQQEYLTILTLWRHLDGPNVEMSF